MVPLSEALDWARNLPIYGTHKHSLIDLIDFYPDVFDASSLAAQFLDNIRKTVIEMIEDDPDEYLLKDLDWSEEVTHCLPISQHQTAQTFFQLTAWRSGHCHNKYLSVESMYEVLTSLADDAAWQLANDIVYCVYGSQSDEDDG